MKADKTQGKYIQELIFFSDRQCDEIGAIYHSIPSRTNPDKLRVSLDEALQIESLWNVLAEYENIKPIEF